MTPLRMVIMSMEWSSTSMTGLRPSTSSAGQCSRLNQSCMTVPALVPAGRRPASP